MHHSPAGSAFDALVAARSTSLAGLYVAMTRRCPFECAHCSTRSGPHASGDIDVAAVERFFASVAGSALARPRHVYFTGGEALLHAAAVERLAKTARGWGAAPHLITGGYFANSRALPRLLEGPLRQMSTVTFSWDRFHAEFLAVDRLKRAIRWMHDRGIEAAVQFTRTVAPDDTLAELRATFPALRILTTDLVHLGRAADSGLTTKAHGNADVPCIVASWPVISYFGHITACCNQDLVDARPADVPEHLLLGRVATSSWDEVVARRADSALLAHVETLGPASAAQAQGLRAQAALDQCGTCRSLSGDVRLPRVSEPLFHIIRDLRREKYRTLVG